MTLTNLKQALKDKKVKFGIEQTRKLVKNGKATEVIIASNCQENIEKELKHLADVFEIKLTKLEQNNEELGTICKKPFSVSVLSY